MNVLKITIFSFLLISGISHAAPEIINSNAVVYKTIGDITLKLHVYNPKNLTNRKYTVLLFSFMVGAGIMAITRHSNANRCILLQGGW